MCSVDDQRRSAHSERLEVPVHNISERFYDRLYLDTYASIMALEAFGLPNRHIDCIDPIANSSHDSTNDQLHAFRCRRLENGSDYHDPASPHDTALPTIVISSQEGHNCADETADIIDTGDDAFDIGARIVELGAKRRQANYGAKNTLVIAKKLIACQSV